MTMKTRVVVSRRQLRRAAARAEPRRAVYVSPPAWRVLPEEGLRISPKHVKLYSSDIGGVLASPENKGMLAATSQIMHDKHISVIYTGIHTTYSKGDYTTVTDYILNNGTASCYKHREGRSWPAAFRTCQAEDAYLAIINSKKESEFLKKLFAQNLPHTIPGRSLGEFATFNYGEPNNIGNNETCGSVWRSGFLNDHNCDRPMTFICEKLITSNIDLKGSSDNL